MTDQDKESSDLNIDEFTSEAEDIIENLNADLLALGSSADEVDPSLLNGIFRSAHTLKGMAGMFGLDRLSDVSHNMENLLDSLRLGKISLSDSIVDLLFESIELISEMVKGGGAVSDEKRLEGLLKNLEKVTSQDSSAIQRSPLESLNIKDGMLAVLTEYEEHRLLEGIRAGKNIYVIHTSFSLDSFDKGLNEISTKVKDFGEIISTLPSSEGVEGGGIAFDILFSSLNDLPLVEEKICSEGVSISLASEGKKDEPGRNQASEGDEKGTGEDLSLSSVKSISKTVRVDISKLDILMNIVGELLISRSAIGHITEEVKNVAGQPALAVSLHRANRDLGRKLVDLQEGLMEIRMISLGNLFDRLAMTVRKIARSHHKQIDMKVEGADTKLDKLLVEEVGDPLMHIIRNAVDHGIEPPVLRKESGKPETGTVILRAYQKGNNVSIEIKDDGAGIDKERIYRKAVQKGLVKGDADLSDDEIIDLIFTAGFSTSSEVSEISGRGVGMDVVKNNIAKISGHIDIETEKGKGSKFTITLPITLAIIQALIIETASKTYAIPLNSIQESLLISRDDIETVDKREVIRHRNSTLPLIRLEDIFDLERTEITHDEVYVIIVAIAQHRFGLLVDNLIGEQDIVIKSIGDIFSHIKGIAGASDLGNNKTVLVLDVASIIEEIAGV